MYPLLHEGGENSADHTLSCMGCCEECLNMHSAMVGTYFSMQATARASFCSRLEGGSRNTRKKGIYPTHSATDRSGSINAVAPLDPSKCEFQFVTLHLAEYTYKRPGLGNFAFSPCMYTIVLTWSYICP